MLAWFAAAALAGCTLQGERARCPACPEMVVIPGGVATFGALADDAFARPDELPRREVALPRFAVSKFEITRAQYQAFVDATRRPVTGNCLTDRRKRGDWQFDAETTYLDPGFAQGDNHPVACVSYDDALAYVAWLNQQGQGGFRLLSEVEWEYLARAGGHTGNYPWGDGPDGCAQANGFDATTMAVYRGMDTSGYPVFDSMTCSDGWLHTSPVGTLKPNAFGVYDITGNVAEWVEDCHTPSHDSAPPPGACAKRVVKGGSWGTLTHNLRIADRFPYAPTHRDDSVGIRVARSLPP